MTKHDMYPSLRGFTLIELLVTMAIFITVITIATGALFASQAVNVKLEQTQTILDELNLSTELMIHDVRYGTSFYCSTTVPASAPLQRQSCPYSTGGGTVLIFRPATSLASTTNPLNDRIGYYIASSTLYKIVYPSGGTATISQVTSSDISLSNLKFYVNGAQSTTGTNDVGNVSDLNQPVITIGIAGITVPTKSNVQPVSFNMEASISSREIDN